MRSVTPMRAAKIGYIIMSALFCVIGLVLMLAPETAFTWLGRLLGISIIVFGGIKLVGYFSRDLFRLYLCKFYMLCQNIFDDWMVGYS